MFGKILSSTVNICAYEFRVYSFLYAIKYIIVNDYFCHLCGVILTLKNNAVLRGDVLKDVATGQQYKLHPSAQDLQEGIWQYHPQVDGGNWNYVIRDGITYAVNELFIDWDNNDMSVWNPNEMGQWPFGNQLSEDEVLLKDIDDVLFYLDSYLEAELEWMDRMEDEENEDSDAFDDDSDIDDVSEDEGYNTSPEVDFEQFDYWALGLNSHLWRIDLYKESNDGFWTL